MAYSTEEVRVICAGFVRGDTAEVEIARGWVRGVVRGGNWRFDDPESVEQDALLRLCCSAADFLHAGSSEEAEARALRRERIDALVYVFQKLPEACREIWRRLYSEGAPTEDVASALGISVNNLRVRVHRCLRKAQELRASFAEIA